MTTLACYRRMPKKHAALVQLSAWRFNPYATSLQSVFEKMQKTRKMEHFREKWRPVFVKKMRRLKEMEHTL